MKKNYTSPKFELENILLEDIILVSGSEEGEIGNVNNAGIIDRDFPIF